MSESLNTALYIHYGWDGRAAPTSEAKQVLLRTFMQAIQVYQCIIYTTRTHPHSPTPDIGF